MLELLLLRDGITISNISSLLIDISFEMAKSTSELWYESKLFAALSGVVLGAILTFAVNLYYIKYRERKELEIYEYFLLTKSKKLLGRYKPKGDNEDLKRELNKFISEFYSDLRYPKVKSSKLLTDALLKILEGKEDVSQEVADIDNRLRMIRLSS